MRLAHLQVKDRNENENTLICSLSDGSIIYHMYRGWGSAGQSLSEGYLSDKLPVSKAHPAETGPQFKDRLIKFINEQTGSKVINDISVNITF